VRRLQQAAGKALDHGRTHRCTAAHQDFSGGARHRGGEPGDRRPGGRPADGLLGWRHDASKEGCAQWKEYNGMKKQLTALFAITAAGALALSGCSSERTTDTPSTGATGATAGGQCIADGAAIGVALPQKTSENWVLAEQLFNDGLTEAGFEPIVQFANNGVTEQQNQISSMVERGAKVIIVGAIDGSQLGGQLEA